MVCYVRFNIDVDVSSMVFVDATNGAQCHEIELAGANSFDLFCRLKRTKNNPAKNQGYKDLRGKPR